MSSPRTSQGSRACSWGANTRRPWTGSITGRLQRLTVGSSGTARWAGRVAMPRVQRAPARRASACADVTFALIRDEKQAPRVTWPRRFRKSRIATLSRASAGLSPAGESSSASCLATRPSRSSRSGIASSQEARSRRHSRSRRRSPAGRWRSTAPAPSRPTSGRATSGPSSTPATAGRRYYLVWITELPPSRDKVEITQLTLSAPKV
jgi:hypothetical protein